MDSILDEVFKENVLTISEMPVVDLLLICAERLEGIQDRKIQNARSLILHAIIRLEKAEPAPKNQITDT